MRISPEHPLAISHALLRPNVALAAIEALRSVPGPVATDGLVELLHEPPSARTATAAIAALEGRSGAGIVEALRTALASPHVTVRLAAVQALQLRDEARVEEDWRHLLCRDSSWQVRRAALRALAERRGEARWWIVEAVTDPHWRVRHALIQALLHEEGRQEIDARLAAVGGTARIEGVRRYLRYRWTGEVPAGPFEEEVGPPWPFWDWDAAVLARKLERLGGEGRRSALDAMPELLVHDEGRVRSLALEALRLHGGAGDLARVVALFDEPRRELEAVTKLLGYLDLDRTEAVARFVRELPSSSPAQRAWALDPGAGRPAPVRVPGDEGPLSRAAALTPERAAVLLAEPESESSWHVLAKAARLRKVPLWEVAPERPWQPPQAERAVAVPLHLPRRAPERPRMLGGLEVAPLGISGHYALPVEGFARAYEAGVNLLFWEPSYQTLTELSARLSPSDRRAIHFLAGTFEADGERVERDAERALRQLRLERLDVFLLFWVRSWDRVALDVRAALERLQRAGKVGVFGLSTHSRALAVEALESGWAPVMVRHSAAHRGAEKEVFPAAVAKGVGVITFNNTCYGRLLQARKGAPPVSAADCYRYALAQPGVAACLSAPATLEQLDENLEALHKPELPPEWREALLAQGERTYQEDAVFRRLVRSR